MAFKHGYVFSTLRVAFLAVVLFFVIFFLAPGASQRFFGTSIKDAKIKEVTAEATTILTDKITSLDEDDIKELLNDPKVRQTIINATSTSKDVVAEVVSYVQNEIGEER